MIASSVYRLRPKIPNYGYGEVPWHQDSGYFEPYCDKDLVVTVWLPLVDADVENGCMWVMPRSHRGPVARHKLAADGKYLQIDPTEFPRTGVHLSCPLKGWSPPGDQPHRARQLREYDNGGGEMEHGPPLPECESPDEREREPGSSGNAVHDPVNGVPIACYPPEADFLVRSVKRPNEVVTDPERFRQIRERYVKPSRHRSLRSPLGRSVERRSKDPGPDQHR